MNIIQKIYNTLTLHRIVISLPPSQSGELASLFVSPQRTPKNHFALSFLLSNLNSRKAGVETLQRQFNDRLIKRVRSGKIQLSNSSNSHFCALHKAEPFTGCQVLARRF
jgi:hypothetical protein